MPIGLMDFPILTMQQASPISSAIANYTAIQDALKKRQQAQKQSQLIQAEIASLKGPLEISAGQKPFINEEYNQALKKTLGIGAPLQQQTFGPIPTGTGLPTTNEELKAHIIANMGGLTHPAVAHAASSQTAALQQLLQMLPTLQSDASQYGGAEGLLGSFFGTTGAKKYNAEVETARQLAREGGISPSFLDRSWDASSVGGPQGSIAQMADPIKQMLANKQAVAQSAATGSLLTKPQAVGVTVGNPDEKYLSKGYKKVDKYNVWYNPITKDIQPVTQ